MWPIVDTHCLLYAVKFPQLIIFNMQLDALIPACEAFGKSISDGASGVAAFEAAVMDAQNGCESTADMSARCPYLFVLNICIFNHLCSFYDIPLFLTGLVEQVM